VPPKGIIHFSMGVFSHWSQRGIKIALGSMKVTVTTCPTEQKWFNLFLQGTKNRMGYMLQRNQPFGTGAIAKMLELVIEEAELE
jgi:hypothetical protein